MKLPESMIHKIIEKIKKKDNIGSGKCELQQKAEGEKCPKMVEKENSRITVRREAQRGGDIDWSRETETSRRNISEERRIKREKETENIWCFWFIWSSEVWGINE